MKTNQLFSPWSRILLCLGIFLGALGLQAQTLINVDFGVGSQSRKSGFAATGQGTNDFWNLYRHYDPKYVPGMSLVTKGELKELKLSDGTATGVNLFVHNAPGVWGNATGDAMYDGYIYAMNGSNIVVRIAGLEPGRYHFYLYGHADPDVTGEQNSVFRLHSSTNHYAPQAAVGSAGWKATTPWQEDRQFVVFRDVEVRAQENVTIEVTGGPNGVAVLNGMQILSRGTSPPRLVQTVPSASSPGITNLFFKDVRFDGLLSETEARFKTQMHVESLTTNELHTVLFRGDVAVVPGDLPEGVRLVNSPAQVSLIVSKPGAYELKFDVLAKIVSEEPWNRVVFTGPPAAIAELKAKVEGDGAELQLLSGTSLSGNGKSVHGSIEGLLDATRQVSLRWQGKRAEVTRKSLVTVDTTSAAHITPTVIKYETQLSYEILQAPVARLRIELPTQHILTRLEGQQIRDWQVENEGGVAILRVEFLKPVEKAYDLKLYTEQPLAGADKEVLFNLPRPLGVEREAGSLTLTPEEMVLEVKESTGMRQVNASGKVFAAYRFYARPFRLATRVQRIEPLISTHDTLLAKLEDTRFLITHLLDLKIERAGIYGFQVPVPKGFQVSEASGSGMEEWKVVDGVLRVQFDKRLLGERRVEIQLEQALRDIPPKLAVLPLRVVGASRETAQIGASVARGLQVKTDSVTGLREVPATMLMQNSRTQKPMPGMNEAVLAYVAEQPDWELNLAAEKLAPRIVADVFNLITVGDGLVGGSATIRYGIINQGVQEFKVTLPAHWKNVEFTGPHIRRKDKAGDVWTITLQDKAWNAYTLVITYDYPFELKGNANGLEGLKTSLDLAGAHVQDVERETGTVAVTTAASLKLMPQKVQEPLRVIDPTELTEADRSLITRPVLLAYRYAADNFALGVDVTRHELASVLEAVADRTQLTSVLTEDGQMLTQASFMVKNNEKQFQRFRLPANARLWGCYVNGDPVKAETDKDWTLVSLPQTENRDQAFAVDIVYAQQIGALGGVMPKDLQLHAPKTDLPNAYAEWQLYVPTSQRLGKFAGTMTVARGTTYSFSDAWDEFFNFYLRVWRGVGMVILVVGIIGTLMVALIKSMLKRGSRGFVEVMAVFAVLAILAGMLLPSLAKSKAKAQRIKASSNLKQIALAAKMYAAENGSRFPNTPEQMMQELGTDRILQDPESGQRFVWVGAGKSENNPNGVLAYSPTDINGRAVAFADGSVRMVDNDEFFRVLASENSSLAMSAVSQRSQALRDKPAAESATAFAASAPDATVALAIPAVPPQVVLGASARQIEPNAGLAITTNGTAFITATPLEAAVSGIRSIRIEIPKTGRAFNFTKVLNNTQEPLSLDLSVMQRRVYDVARMVLQLLAFLGGLFLLWREWHRPQASSLRLAFALLLAVGAVVNLMIAYRLLHWVLILGAPLLWLLAMVWLFRKFWSTGSQTDEGSQPAAAGHPTTPPVPSAVSAIILWLGLTLAGSTSLEAKTPAVHNAAEANQVTVMSVEYTGSIQEKVALLEATIKLHSVGTNQTVHLFDPETAVQEFQVVKGQARLLNIGKSTAVMLSQPGDTVLHLKLASPVDGDVSKRQLAFIIPVALSSRVSVLIEDGDAEVEFPSALSFRRTIEAGKTRIEGVIGSSERFSLEWTPRVKRATEVAVSAFCEQNSLITLGGGVQNTRTLLKYQATQGELKHLEVRLPAGQRLLRVEGLSMRNWELQSGSEGEVLRVELLKGVAAYQLTLETEMVLEKLPATAHLMLPHALQVLRETGSVAVKGGEEVSLTVMDSQGLQRIDNEEFNRQMGSKDGGLLSAWRFLKPGFALDVQVEAIQPQIEVAVKNQIALSLEQAHLVADLAYAIKRAGVFRLRMVLPAGYRVDNVTGNGKPMDWSENREARTLDVVFKERLMGNFNLRLDLTQTYMNLPANLPVQGVHPMEVQKLSGFVVITSDSGVSAKTQQFSGLTEIPATALGNGREVRGGLAFKYQAADPVPLKSPWQLSIQTETVEPWTKAEVVNIITMNETLITGRSLVRYEIENAPAREFKVLVPAAYKNVEILGNDIRRRDENNGEWRVELQNRVRGNYMLTVTWEMPRSAATNLVQLAGVQAVNVERETGDFTLLAKAPLQIVEKALQGDLTRIDARELPEWAGVSRGGKGEAPVLSYRYLRPGATLDVAIERFADASVLQALVDEVKLATVVADDGQVMTEMMLKVRNNGRQHLEIELPVGSELWAAFVDGEPVRPGKRGAKLLVPLEKSGAEAAPVDIQLTYVGATKFPKRKGQFDLVSPQLDIPLKNARWDLYLPTDYEYEPAGGSMNYEAGAGPVLQTYTMFEYNSKEQDYRQKQVVANARFLDDTKSDLKQGNVEKLGEFFSRARSNRKVASADEARDFQQLEEQVKRSQASNLINAQNMYADNYAQSQSGGQGGQGGSWAFGARREAGAKTETEALGRYDLEVAERQVAKLQHAQELTTTQVQPLRVNLPTRGLVQSFTQVMQTEGGKPMSIALSVNNTRDTGWTGNLGRWFGWFGVLWVVAHLLLRRRNERATLKAA